MNLLVSKSRSGFFFFWEKKDFKDEFGKEKKTARWPYNQDKGYSHKSFA